MQERKAAHAKSSGFSTPASLKRSPLASVSAWLRASSSWLNGSLKSVSISDKTELHSGSSPASTNFLRAANAALVRSGGSGSSAFAVRCHKVPVSRSTRLGACATCTTLSGLSDPIQRGQADVSRRRTDSSSARSSSASCTGARASIRASMAVRSSEWSRSSMIRATSAARRSRSLARQRSSTAASASCGGPVASSCSCSSPGPGSASSAWS